MVRITALTLITTVCMYSVRQTHTIIAQHMLPSKPNRSVLRWRPRPVAQVRKMLTAIRANKIALPWGSKGLNADERVSAHLRRDCH